MKRLRDDDAHPPTAPSSTHPQRVVEESGARGHSGGPSALVLYSPYGGSRNTRYGWGDLFHRAVPAQVPGYEEAIHIGISSLNAVTTGKGADRSMRGLLQQYRRVFGCLEHCYPFHRVGDAATWASWADMVRTPDAGPAAVMPPAPSATGDVRKENPVGASIRRFCAPATRFQFTVKANNYLTHVKLLNMDDAEVATHVRLFFGELCAQLDPFLGPVLVQLPPSFQRTPANIARLVALDALLPKEEIEIERSPSDARGSREWYRRRRVRVAVEFRHRSWFHEETFRTLRTLGWALVTAHHDSDTTFATPVDTGVPFLYVRLHGSMGRNVGDYGPVLMDIWAERVLHFLRIGAGVSVPPAEGFPESVSVQHSSRQVPCPREVFFFLNNSDSHVAGVTSSTVDARYLAEALRRRLSPLHAPHNPTEPAPHRGNTAPTPAWVGRASDVAESHSVSLASVPSVVFEGATTGHSVSESPESVLDEDGTMVVD